MLKPRKLAAGRTAFLSSPSIGQNSYLEGFVFLLWLSAPTAPRWGSCAISVNKHLLSTYCVPDTELFTCINLLKILSGIYLAFLHLMKEENGALRRGHLWSSWGAYPEPDCHLTAWPSCWTPLVFPCLKPRAAPSILALWNICSIWPLTEEWVTDFTNPPHQCKNVGHMPGQKMLQMTVWSTHSWPFSGWSLPS